MTFEEKNMTKVPFIPYYTDDELAVGAKLVGTSIDVTQGVSTSSHGFSFVGVTYLISNLFAFMNVIILFNFLDLKWVLYPYKELLKFMFNIFLDAANLSTFA